MKHVLVRVAAVGLAAAAGTGVLVAQAQAAKARTQRYGGHAVFVQTNAASGNQVLVFDRAGDGGLTQAGAYSTGGAGEAATGAVSDTLASQGSLVYDAAHSMLFAVNAGSNSISAFTVRGDRLRLIDVVSSGGEFPASLAVHGNLLYALDSGGAGVIQGFRIAGPRLVLIPGSSRSLGLANADPPDFLASPGQIGFTPDGRQLIVTTKTSGSSIDVFSVLRDGRPSFFPRVNASATPVPFAFTFDPRSGRLVVGEAGASNVTAYRLGFDGSIVDPHSLSDGQGALCWIVRVGGFYYVSNTATNTISAYTIGFDGVPALLFGNEVAASTEAGPVDLAASSDGRFLYLQTGAAGTLDAFAVNRDGSLSKLQALTLTPGMEGIAAS
jgi:6-phosphogluconolactonase (cycloisomerase 2 family)